MKKTMFFYASIFLLLSVNNIYSLSDAEPYRIQKQSDGSYTLFHIEQKMLLDGSSYEIATPITELPTDYAVTHEHYHDVLMRLAKKYQWKSAQAAACVGIFLLHTYLINPWLDNKIIKMVRITKTIKPPHIIRWLEFGVNVIKSFYLALGAETLFGLCYFLHELSQGPDVKIVQQAKHN